MAIQYDMNRALKSAGMKGSRKRHGKGWNPGGEKGKLHRELGIPEDQTIPPARLQAAMHSTNPEVKRDAIRANTMKHWNHKR